MKLARSRAIPLIIMLIAAGAATAYFMAHRSTALNAQPRQRTILLLLTSLPLVLNEDFALSGGGSPALDKLRTQYDVLPISLADDAELAKGNLLIMAQPPTQTAENLVVLDQWVRRGGHLLLLADPLLEWPSKRPLDDPLHPPVMFMDTGLLAHWGLRLDAPDRSEQVTRKLGGYDVKTLSPGSLSGACPISDDRLVAHCRIGKGRATIIADADLLDVRRLGSGAEHNLDGLMNELARVDR